MSMEHAQPYMLPLAAMLLGGSAQESAINLAELRAEAAPKDFTVRPSSFGAVSYAARGVAADGSGTGAARMKRLSGCCGPRGR
ncbi:hypothetical protein CDA63_11815 [Hymenobacter amundsenii]|uniref:Uncharacterized protein n=2 Tax=Hymenobacter amundsenii TaxID=2006685 RepID=A0A246FK29_9BACT|nr:hypothetical protein CDA63_11815 [Hymenobacter amundsenii]